MAHYIYKNVSKQFMLCVSVSFLFKIRQSKIALNQTLTLKLGVTLVLTVTQVYDFVNPRQVMDVPP